MLKYIISNGKFLIFFFLDRIKTLELNDKGLRSQISELVAEKEKYEEQIDGLGEELESRIKQLTVKYSYNKKYLRLM